MRESIYTATLLAIVLPAIDAQAGLLPSTGVTPEGSHYRYEYDVGLQSGSVLQNGDYFTIYDFAGFVAGSNSQPDGFAFSSATTGPTPGGVLPEDDGSVANLTWTYVGGDTIGPVELGTFAALSEYGETTSDSFAGRSHRTADGRLNSNITETEVPVPMGPPNLHVPEPSTLVLLAAGLPLMLGVRKWWNRIS